MLQESCFPVRNLIIALGFFTTFVTYMTRNSLNMAIIAMVKHDEEDNNVVNGTRNYDKGEFEWSQSQQGIVLGSFAYGYVCLQIVGGRLAEKFGAKWIVATSLALSTILSCLQPVIARFSFVLLIISRVVLGKSKLQTY